MKTRIVERIYYDTNLDLKSIRFIVQRRFLFIWEDPLRYVCFKTLEEAKVFEKKLQATKGKMTISRVVS